MKAIKEFEYPTKDKSKNYILQLEAKGIEKSVAKLIKKRFNTEFICNVMDDSPEYIARIRKTYLSN